VGGPVHGGLSGIECPPQRTVLFTDIGVENVATGLSEGIPAGDADNALGSPIKGGNSLLQIDGEDPLVDGIEDDVFCAGLGIFAHEGRPYYRALCTSFMRS